MEVTVLLGTFITAEMFSASPRSVSQHNPIPELLGSSFNLMNQFFVIRIYHRRTPIKVQKLLKDDREKKKEMKITELNFKCHSKGS